MKRPKNIEKTAQLLEGIGASSWFCIKPEGLVYRIERFSIEGELECSKVFQAYPDTFNINYNYNFTYVSHCKECTVVQNKITYRFKIYEP